MSKISLCMIVGNVEEYIDRCLTSFAPLADEICVVRAIGCAEPDKTLDIARDKFKARTAEYRNAAGHEDWPHVDSFAAARQQSYDMAENDLCFWCDSDDVLEEGSAQYIRELATRGGFACFMFPYKIFGRGVVVPRERMMLRTAGTWKYPVHECFKFHKEPVSAVEDKRVVITHLPELHKQGGNERNLRILKSIPEEEMTAALLYHIQGELAAAKEYDASVDAAKRALASPDLKEPERYELFLNLFNMAKDPKQKLIFLHQAYATDPLRREALGLLATTSLDMGQTQQALAYARQMMATTKPDAPAWNSRDAAYGYVGAEIYAQALRANGEYAEAECVRQIALKAAGGPRVALIHPTRGDPVKAAMTRKLWWDLADQPDRVEHCFCIWADDEESACLGRMHHVIMAKGRDDEWAWKSGVGATAAHVVIRVENDITPPLKWDNLILDKIGDPTKAVTLSGIRPRVCTRYVAGGASETIDASDIQFGGPL
jgi:tetratricopeptide (TPR) repeat protein